MRQPDDLRPAGVHPGVQFGEGGEPGEAGLGQQRKQTRAVGVAGSEQAGGIGVRPDGEGGCVAVGAEELLGGCVEGDADARLVRGFELTVLRGARLVPDEGTSRSGSVPGEHCPRPGLGRGVRTRACPSRRVRTHPALPRSLRHRHQRRPDLDDLSGSAVQGGHRPGERAGQRDDGLGRLDLGHGLVVGDVIAHGDRPFQYLGLRQTFTQVRQLEGSYGPAVGARPGGGHRNCPSYARARSSAVGQQPPQPLQHPPGTRQMRALQQRWRVGDVEARDAQHGGPQSVEAALLDLRGDLCADPGEALCLVHDQAAAGAPYRLGEGVVVERDDGAQVQHLDVHALGRRLPGGLQGDGDRRAVRDERGGGAGAADRCGTERLGA